MKIIRVICSILAITFGAFLVVYGERDDSPGGQVIGLVLVIFGVVSLIKSGKKNSTYLLIAGLIIAIIGFFAAWQLVPKEALEKTDLIRLDSPRPGEVIESPLTITGEARGVWFFEASFPVVLVNWDGLIIAEGIATAQSNWMTNDFVPFQATLVFPVDKNAYSNRGALILRKDNPSGLPEHDDALEIPVLLDKEEFNNINN